MLFRSELWCMARASQQGDPVVSVLCPVVLCALSVCSCRVSSGLTKTDQIQCACQRCVNGGSSRTGQNWPKLAKTCERGKPPKPALARSADVNRGSGLCRQTRAATLSRKHSNSRTESRCRCQRTHAKASPSKASTCQPSKPSEGNWQTKAWPGPASKATQSSLSCAQSFCVLSLCALVVSVPD